MGNVLGESAADPAVGNFEEKMMRRIRMQKAETRKWCTLHDMMPPEIANNFEALELSGQVAMHELGNKDSLQLSETRYPAHSYIRPHAHEIDEIFYIADGEIRFGSSVLRKGGSVFIARNTLYTFRAGPEGVHLVVFRPYRDLSYVSRDEFIGKAEGERDKKVLQFLAGH